MIVSVPGINGPVVMDNASMIDLLFKNQLEVPHVKVDVICTFYVKHITPTSCGRWPTDDVTVPIENTMHR